MVRQSKVIVVGSNSIAADQQLVRDLRGSPFGRLDSRFFAIAILSAAVHVGILIYVNRLDVRPPESMVIEEVPERFAKLIIEKPLPKKVLAKEVRKSGPATPDSRPVNPIEKSNPQEVNDAQRRQARKAVDAQVARVEQKIRTVGVLGMLSGSGGTAKGPAVVNVLEAMGARKETTTDLDAALENMGGLKRTDNVNILTRQLVAKSKDAQVNYKESIDDLMTSLTTTNSTSLAKAGNFIIQKPEAIEGAASSNAKRESAAINAVVSHHKTSIRMSYDKYLKRDPSLAGKITVRFTIAASGDVTMVKILENTTGNIEFEQEIVRKVRMWRFDSIPEGDVTVTYPFVFSTAG